MKIQLGGLSETTHRFEFHVDASDLKIGQSFAGSVTVFANVERIGNQFRLKADVTALGSFDCDRCLVRFDRNLSSSYRMHYITDEVEAAAFDPAEVQIVSPGFQVVDLTDDVREIIELSVPLKLLCKNNCAGLCPHCARNLNEEECDCRDVSPDSRWDELRKLLNN